MNDFNGEAEISIQSLVGEPVRRVGIAIAVAFSLSGAFIAAFVSGSLEQRIGILALWGMGPGLSVCVGAYILSHLLVFTAKLCEMLTARLLRSLTLFLIRLFSWVSLIALKAQATLSQQHRIISCLIGGHYRRAYKVAFDFICLLIRSTAQFAIKMQALPAR